MATHSPSRPTRQDANLLRMTLLRLTAVPVLICLAVVAAVALIWLRIARIALDFGRNLNYDGLGVLGEEGTALLIKYSPYFWWGIVLLATLLLALAVLRGLRAAGRGMRQRIIGESDIQALASSLSEPAREVLAWAWQDRRHPLTVGVLQHAARELRHGRAALIELARRQATLLALPEAGAAPTSPRRQEPLIAVTPPAQR